MYKVQILDLKREIEKHQFNTLVLDGGLTLFDRMEFQLLDLMMCRHPSLSAEAIKEQGLVQRHLDEMGQTSTEYGKWVYYPWKNSLVHILPEKEFVEVRTNRNMYKITPAEQELLATKKIGIVGLSVGRTVATTMALERVAGEIRLADFDEIELSNLNRIKAPLFELGLNKAIATAREIAEIDPYIKVICYEEGLTDENINDFLLLSGKLDLFIEECDDIAIKIKSRLKCREMQIPVIMETNDNCIIDIERFDLEPERLIFHGKLSEEEIEQGISAKTMMEKIVILSKVLDIQNVSQELLYSLPQMGKTIRSWPQLGSDVVYGAGVVTNISREMMLGKKSNSGQIVYKIQNN